MNEVRKERQIGYLTLVRGHWSLGRVRLEHRLAVTRGEGGERHVVAGDTGKPSACRVAPVDIARRASLLEVTLETGRTHQIRVQLAAEGHPLAGDERYGDPDFNRRLAGLGLKRMFLHAHALAFDDPVTGEPRAFSAPLPDDLRRVAERLTG